MSIKSALCFILIFILLLSVFSLSALAASTEEVFVIPVTSSSVQSLQSSGVYVGNSSSYSIYCGMGSSPAYGALYYTTISGVQNVYCYCISESRQALYYINAADGCLSTNNLASTVINGTTYYYGIAGNWPLLSSSGYDIFPNQSSAKNAILEYISNPPSPVSPSSLQYSLPPGNSIYIQVPTGASYTLRTRMPESVLGCNHYPGNNQAITLVSSLPSGGTAPSSPLIPWQQDGALSVLGLSRNAVYNGSNASAGYLCIVNPLYYSGTANGPYEFLSNGSIDITIDRQTGFVVYPLDSTLGFTSGLGINVDTEILDSPFTGGIDPDTGEIIWQDSSGGSSAPTTGGGNLVSTSETIFDFLRNIGDEISTFLKGPIQAIQTVVSAIREFLGSFTQLYMWLPAPVYNLITSALMIALTIGVIKIFV